MIYISLTQKVIIIIHLNVKKKEVTFKLIMKAIILKSCTWKLNYQEKNDIARM